MKTQLTPENKGRFFAQYYGQEVYNPNDGNPIVMVSALTLMDVHNYHLLLKPLSAITDEDAIEVYRLYFGSDTAMDFTGDTGSAYFQPKRVTPDDFYVQRIISGEDYETGDFQKVIEVTDFLRSKGYAMPWMGLSVEEMIVANWIKLQ